MYMCHASYMLSQFEISSFFFPIETGRTVNSAQVESIGTEEKPLT